MDGEVVPIRGGEATNPEAADGAEPVAPDAVLAVVQHPLDTTDPVPMRTRQEMLAEALLLVPNLAKLLYRLLRDKRVPRKRRLAMTVVGVYVASPIDIVPDFIPVLGSVDDLLVLAFAIDYLLRASPQEAVEEHWDGSQDGLELVRGIAAWGVELLPGRFRRFVEGD
jgi:uncharacterized membrane protein YkvA (DUF1232 family)